MVEEYTIEGYPRLTGPFGSRFRDISGWKFGRLEVIYPSERIYHGKATRIKWLCRCDCGNLCLVAGCNLNSGNSTSCGCFSKEKSLEAHTSHGLSHSRTYNIWSNIKQRCRNPHHKDYDRYGGRGIDVCDEWYNSFEKFLEYVRDLPHYYEKGYTIDRIDVDGNYEPDNIRWVDMLTQQNNRRNNRLIDYNGETHTITDWGRLLGIDRNLIALRLKRGWSVERTFNEPVHTEKHHKN